MGDTVEQYGPGPERTPRAGRILFVIFPSGFRTARRTLLTVAILRGFIFVVVEAVFFFRRTGPGRAVVYGKRFLMLR